MLFESNFFHQEHELSTMMHTVCEEVGDGATKSLELGWVVERIQKAVIVPLFAGNAPRHVGKISANAAQSLDQFWNRVSRSFLNRPFAQQIRPDFHVPDDVHKGFAQGMLVNVELLVQHVIGQ